MVLSPRVVRHAEQPTQGMERVRSDGKHFCLEGKPFRVKGVTYGSFVPRVDGEPFPERPQLKHDLIAMAETGINTVRTYTVPPVELLDLAAELELRVLVGVHFPDWRYHSRRGRRINRAVMDAGRRAVEEAMVRCTGRPEVLAVSVGNEVPADLVRLHGVGAVEDVLAVLAAEVHTAEPQALTTYGNFPTTEYLEVEGLDVVSFNVFLEDPVKLRRYLRHLQIVAGDKPLVITELGLAGEVQGTEAQAESLRWQLRAVDEVGCAGATVFAWTDEWGVDGRRVEGWGFGLTTSDRDAKPALDVVAEWASRGIRELRDVWPRVSVVVCAYNEERTIEECLASLAASDYPDLEVIVCDDGSTDRTAALAGRFPFRILELPHGGLSRARNAGLAAATGTVVAYLDADAACHPEWPYHLAISLEDDRVVATGGPNLPVYGVGRTERAVDRCPGQAMAVLVGDDRAEHVPGCNSAFDKDALIEIGGFNPIYTSAGDDVDVCWKLLDRGYEIAFSPAAQVRHHRRATARGYLRQQHGYGRAERLLFEAHRHRFNRLRQARWNGVIYGGLRPFPGLKPVIYHGAQGHAPYQTVTRRPAEAVSAYAAAALPLLAVPLAAGLVLAPLSAWALVSAVAAGTALLVYFALVANAVPAGRDEARPWTFRALVGLLHLAQPFVRTRGRLGRPQPAREPASSAWKGCRGDWLADLDRALRESGCIVRYPVSTARHDLVAWRLGLVAARITTAVVWSWTPCWSVTYRLRPGGGLLLALSALVVLSSGPAWVAAAAVALLVVEVLVLHRAVARAVGATTAGAATSER